MKKQVKKSEQEIKIAKSIQSMRNGMASVLDNIYQCLENNAKSFNTTSVPLVLVKRYHDIVKASLEEGYKEGATKISGE